MAANITVVNIGMMSTVPEHDLACSTRSVSLASSCDENDESATAGVSNSKNEAYFEQDKDNEERKSLAMKETKAVSRLRIMVLAVLLCVALTVTLSTYFYTHQNEQSDFESKFAVNADKVMVSFHNNVQRKISAIDSFSVAMTSHALATNATFPNVTLPDFVVLGSATRVLADAVVVEFEPLVTKETRLGWEAYAREHFETKYEGIAMESRLRDNQDKKFGLAPVVPNAEQEALDYRVAPAPVIIGVGGPPPANASGPFLPAWQVSPIPFHHEVTKFDKMTARLWRGAIEAALLRSQVVIGEASNLFTPTSNTAGDVMSDFLLLGQYRHEMDAYSGDPVSTMIYPVFDSFSEDRKLVGILDTTMIWKLYFINILPHDVDGIICVLKNSFGQTYTYRIDGPNAYFVGEGDHHDSRYDNMKVSEDVISYLRRQAGPDTQSYTSVDLDPEYCLYSLHIYPSATMEDAYLTKTPMVFTIVVAFVFIFTSTVFISYDYMVERRQNVVMDRALASGAIVSSLFPKEIQDRLYSKDDIEDGNKKNHKSNNFSDASEAKLRNFMSGQGASAIGSSEIVRSQKAIADKFAATTVFFADLVGFTEWSSTREPEQVFELLEAIYGSFDEIALRRGVFKVETIGDCYMAVTGLPKPQDDHALIMARFARDCLAKLRSVTHSIKDRLGEDTADLRMRIGLHSGPVTAGVLRGQKARFQLFGDTVNTASRMESSGAPGCIHVSEATAHALISKGKSHWLLPREGKVAIKGKGDMNTFWVEAAPSSDTAKSRSVTANSVIGEDCPSSD